MSKRKRASLSKTSMGEDQTAIDPSGSEDDASLAPDMAHVSPDALAGGTAAGFRLSAQASPIGQAVPVPLAQGDSEPGRQYEKASPSWLVR